MSQSLDKACQDWDSVKAMSKSGLEASLVKMRAAGVGAAAIDSFTYYYQQLESGVTGIIEESAIAPLAGIPFYGHLQFDEDICAQALAKTVVIKLNGGLGTSMGLSGPKSLLQVRDGLTFLDVCVRQVLAARKRYQVRLPILFMHSFATRASCLKHLSQYKNLAVAGLPIDFEQSMEPKLLADTLEPVTWQANPDLEWCPPGHGDIFPSFYDSGVLDQLIAAGFEYAAISNVDNLGAAPSPKLAGWFASTKADFAVEVCQRTVNDRKGGHLARRKADGKIILRELAQTAPEDEQHFTDVRRHPYFNTNSLWIDLAALKSALDSRGSVLGLPLIRNTKTVDPTDDASPKVIQIETAMGTAVEVFERASVIEVSRARFIPVKKMNELLLLRSDCYELDTSSYQLISATDNIPAVDLDPDYYQLIDDFDARIPHPLSLRDAHSLRVHGDVAFGTGVKIVGDVDLDAAHPETIADNAVLGEK